MKKFATLVLIAVLATALVALLPTAVAAEEPEAPEAPETDHALFDQTSGDVSVSCQGTEEFVVHLSMRAINGDATFRVTFVDGDFVDFPIPNDSSFSLTQAAGGTPTVDSVITVTPAPGSAGQLVGWMSAQELEGQVSCTTT